MDWVFLCFSVLCSALCCLRRIALHSAVHRSGKALKLCPCPWHRDKWHKGKLNKNKKNILSTCKHSLSNYAVSCCSYIVAWNANFSCARLCWKYFFRSTCSIFGLFVLASCLFQLSFCFILSKLSELVLFYSTMSKHILQKCYSVAYSTNLFTPILKIKISIKCDIDN